MRQIPTNVPVTILYAFKHRKLYASSLTLMCLCYREQPWKKFHYLLSNSSTPNGSCEPWVWYITYEKFQKERIIWCMAQTEFQLIKRKKKKNHMDASWRQLFSLNTTSIKETFSVQKEQNKTTTKNSMARNSFSWLLKMKICSSCELWGNKVRRFQLL